MARIEKVLAGWQAIAASVSLAAVRAGGALMFVSAFMVGFDVIARKAIGWSLGGSDELSGYAFAIATSWSLAFALLQRANVRIDALYIHLPRPAAAAIDLLSLLTLGLFVGLLMWFAAAVLVRVVCVEGGSLGPSGLLAGFGGLGLVSGHGGLSGGS